MSHHTSNLYRLTLLLLLCSFIPVVPAAWGDKAKGEDPKKPKPAKPPRIHSVVLGAIKKVSYSKDGDPAGALPGETELKVRPLVVDTRVKDWTTGESHDVTDRSFAIRRALRINDALPTDKTEHWVWQKGPWMLVDRAAGKTVPLKLPDYDPGVSEVSWFRDYAAYCGLTASRKQLYAVVAQVAARKPLLVMKLGAWDAAASRSATACAAANWQRAPLRITFQELGSAPASFDLDGVSAVLIEAGTGEEANEALPDKLE